MINIRKNNFTIIELLIVVSIIAVLVGMLLPVLNSARAKGRQIACTGNLRQIGIAVAEYEDTFDGWMLRAYVNDEKVWIQMLIDCGYVTVGREGLRLKNKS